MDGRRRRGLRGTGKRAGHAVSKAPLKPADVLRWGAYGAAFAFGLSLVSHPTYTHPHTHGLLAPAAPHGPLPCCSFAGRSCTRPCGGRSILCRGTVGL